LEKPSAHPSALYDRANGFLLGCFITMMRFRAARRFAVHRLRVGEFLDEFGLTVELPGTRREFRPKADDLFEVVVRGVHQQAPTMGDFALVGAMACSDGFTRLAGRDVNDEVRQEACEILARHGLAATKLYDRFLAHVVREAEHAAGPGVFADSVLTPALSLLAAAIEPLPPEAATCFVAMPFKRPFSRYFNLFYRSLAEALGCRALRMWGGLSGEAYVDSCWFSCGAAAG